MLNRLIAGCSSYAHILQLCNTTDVVLGTLSTTQVTTVISKWPVVILLTSDCMLPC